MVTYISSILVNFCIPLCKTTQLFFFFFFIIFWVEQKNPTFFFLNKRIQLLLFFGGLNKRTQLFISSNARNLFDLKMSRNALCIASVKGISERKFGFFLSVFWYYHVQESKWQGGWVGVSVDAVSVHGITSYAASVVMNAKMLLLISFEC